jgi:alcohol dehydrogenase
MKAAVYFGPRDVRCVSVPDAELTQEHGMLVKVRTTSICGSDLHIYRGTLDGIMERGHSRLGHELAGEVVAVGAKVARFRPGDRVSMAYSASCGECTMCRVGMTAHCLTTNKAVYGFGTAFGDLNGTQAEYLEIPYADAHALKVDDALSDEEALTLSCNLPTAVIAARLVALEPGQKVALVGLGPSGLLTLELLLHQGAMVVGVDPVAHRRRFAESTFGIVTAAPEEAPGVVQAVTGGIMADRVVEMVGSAESLSLALQLARPGAIVAALGVFTDASVPLAAADVFLRDLTLHMHGFANVQPEMWRAQELIRKGVVHPGRLFSRRYSLDQVGEAYRAFAERDEGVLKVAIVP